MIFVRMVTSHGNDVSEFHQIPPDVFWLAAGISDNGCFWLSAPATLLLQEVLNREALLKCRSLPAREPMSHGLRTGSHNSGQLGSPPVLGIAPLLDFG